MVDGGGILSRSASPHVLVLPALLLAGEMRHGDNAHSFQSGALVAPTGSTYSSLSAPLALPAVLWLDSSSVLWRQSMDLLLFAFPGGKCNFFPLIGCCNCLEIHLNQFSTLLWTFEFICITFYLLFDNWYRILWSYFCVAVKPY